LLALALLHGVIDADQVWAAAHVDEDWNIEKWGVDEEVAARRAARLVDFTAALEASRESPNTSSASSTLPSVPRIWLPKLTSKPLLSKQMFGTLFSCWGRGEHPSRN